MDMDPIKALKEKTANIKAKRKTVAEAEAAKEAKEKAKEEKAAQREAKKQAAEKEKLERAVQRKLEKEAREAARRSNQQDGVMEHLGELFTFRVENDDKVIGTRVVPGTLVVNTAVDCNGVMNLEVVIVRQEDKRTFKATLEMLTMEREDKWNAWFGATAGLCVNLSDRQRLLLKEFVMSQDGAKLVAIQLLRAGYIEEYGIFVAIGHCIDADGHLVPPEDDGGFTLKCSDGVVRVFRTAETTAIQSPTIKEAIAPPPDAATAALRAYLDHMNVYQGDHSGAAAYGWAVASIFHPEFLRERRCFPHLYLYGRRHSGKSTLAGCIMESFGMRDVRAEAADSVKRNPKATRNLLGDTSCVPMWLDDVRSDDGVEVVLNMLRLAFDGSGGRIARRDGQTTVFPVRRGIMVAGQHVIGSDAELRRYVLVDMRERKRDDLYHSITKGAQEIQPAILSLLCRRNHLKSLIIKFAHQYEDALFTLGIGRAMAWPWGIAMAGLRLAYSGDNTDLAPAQALPIGALEYAVSRVRTVREATGAIQTFWQILEVLDASSTPSNSGRHSWGRVISVGDYSHNPLEQPEWVAQAHLEKGIVTAIWLGAAHSHVKKSATGVRQSIHTMDALLREFADEPGYLGTVDGVQLESGQPPRRCMLFKIDAPCIPRWVRDATLKNGQPIPAA